MTTLNAMTHVILFHTAGDPGEVDFVAALTKFCHHGAHWMRVDHKVYAPKGSPAATYLLQFAVLDVGEFVRLVRSVAWEFPTFVAAMLRPPGAALFEPIDFDMADFQERDARTASQFGWGMELPAQQREFAERTYPQMLRMRSDRIRDSLENPNRPFRDLEVLGEVNTGGEWIFECIAAYSDIRTSSAPRKAGYSLLLSETGGSVTEVRRVYVHAAFLGILVHLECFLEVTGFGPDGQQSLDAKRIGSGDRLLIEGVIRVLGDGICDLVDQYEGRLVQTVSAIKSPIETSHE